MDYKDVKVNFVSGHSGTSLVEIALVVSSAPVGLLLRNELQIYAQNNSFWSQFILDNVCLVGPALLCFTVLGDETKQVIGTLLLMTVCLLLYRLFTSTKTRKGWPSIEGLDLFLKIPMSGKRNFISAFRANVNLATSVSILAVDFIIFPRRFCKAETYGTGLMDVGVGAFVISNAIVSPEARGKYPEARGLLPNLSIVFKSIKACTPLLVLGIARILSVKGVDYQEHVTEYGVHWNFFFTLACVRVLSSLVLCCFSASNSWILALGIGLGFQYLLDGPVGLKEFALHGYSGEDTRQGFIEANREGLVSCLGYLAIYFAGVHMGMYLLRIRSTVSEWLWVLVILLGADVIAWICLYVISLNGPVSRRMANLPYVIWMVAYSLQLLASFLVVDIIDVVMKNLNKQTPSDEEEVNMCLLEAVNYNGLFYFLLANLLTGMVNLCLPTVYMSSFPALVIVTSYMVFLSYIMCFLYRRKFSFKFW